MKFSSYLKKIDVFSKDVDKMFENINKSLDEMQFPSMDLDAEMENILNSSSPGVKKINKIFKPSGFEVRFCVIDEKKLFLGLGNQSGKLPNFDLTYLSKFPLDPNALSVDEDSNILIRDLSVSMIEQIGILAECIKEFKKYIKSNPVKDFQ